MPANTALQMYASRVVPLVGYVGQFVAPAPSMLGLRTLSASPLTPPAGGHVVRCVVLKDRGFASELLCSIRVSVCLFSKRSNGFARELRHRVSVVLFRYGGLILYDFLVSSFSRFNDGFNVDMVGLLPRICYVWTN